MNITRKKGGKYIAQGSYGCVFGDPPLKCKNEATRRGKNIVSKIQDETSTNTEYSESELWHKIDPNNKFSITPIRKCDYDNINTSNANETNKCIAKFSTSKKKLLLYKNGGTDLFELKVRADNYAYLFGGFYDLLKGLAIAHKNGIVHNDIKPENILAKRSDRKISLRFIDFGLTYKIYDTEKLNSLIYGGYMNALYYYWPFEIKFFSERSLYNEMYFNSELLKYSDLLINKLRYNVPRSIVINKETNNMYTNLELMEMYSKLNLLDYITKIDVYSMGVTISQLLNYYFKHYMTINSEYKDIIKVVLPDKATPVEVDTLNVSQSKYLTEEIIEWHKTIATNITKPLYTLMLKLLDINPKKRLSAEEAAKEYKKLLPDIFKYLKDEVMIDKVYGAYDNFLDKSPRIQNPPTPSVNYKLNELFSNNNNNNKTKKRKRNIIININNNNANIEKLLRNIKNKRLSYNYNDTNI